MTLPSDHPDRLPEQPTAANENPPVGRPDATFRETTEPLGDGNSHVRMDAARQSAEQSDPSGI